MGTSYYAIVIGTAQAGPTLATHLAAAGMEVAIDVAQILALE